MAETNINLLITGTLAMIVTLLVIVIILGPEYYREEPQKCYDVQTGENLTYTKYNVSTGNVTYFDSRIPIWKEVCPKNLENER